MTKASLNQALAAYADVIRGQQDPGTEHDPTPTEYFAVISSTLRQAAETSPDFLVDSIKLLEAVTTQAAQAIVRGQFRDLSATYMQIITAGADNAVLLKSTLSALGTLLYVQEVGDGFWSGVQALQCVNILLGFLEDANMKLRRTAQDQLLRVLTLHAKNRHLGHIALRSYVGDFCIGILRACTRADYKRSLYVVLFLESAAHLLPEKSAYAQGLFEAALSVQNVGQHVLTAAAMRMFDCFFQAPEFSLSAPDAIACLSTLVSTPLLTTDMESNTFRYLAIGSGLVRVHRLVTLTGAPAELFPQVCATLMHGFETDFIQIHDAVSTTLKRVVGECMDLTSMRVALQYATVAAKEREQAEEQKAQFGNRGPKKVASALASVPVPIVLQVCDLLNRLLHVRYKNAWAYVIPTCTNLLYKVKSAGATAAPDMTGQDVCGMLLAPFIGTLADLYQQTELNTLQLDGATHLALSETMGNVVRSVGFSQFLSIVPLCSNDNPMNLAISDDREWMLPVLHSALRFGPASLCDFAVGILPLIDECQQALQEHQSQKAAGAGGMATAMCKKAHTRILQFWSLFPDFCYYGPMDTGSFFPRIVPELEAQLKAASGSKSAADGSSNSLSKEIAVHILTGLTHLAAGVMEKACPQAPLDKEGRLVRLTLHNRGPITQTGDFTAVSAASSVILPAVLTYLEYCDFNDNTFASAVRCINAWACTAPPALNTAIAKKLLQLLLQSTAASAATSTASGKFPAGNAAASSGSTAEDKAASGWMSILLAVIPFIPQQMVHLLYKTVRPLLSVHESVSSQKRAYNVLDTVLDIHGTHLYELEPAATILAVVCDSLMTCHVSARNARLKCMERLIKNMANVPELKGDGESDSDNDGPVASDSDNSDDDDDSAAAAERMEDANAGTEAKFKASAAYAAFISAADSIFMELLLCQKDSNQKTRESAGALMTFFIKRITLPDMMTRLLAAVNSDNRTLRASALVTICSVLLKHRANLEIVEAHATSLTPRVCAMLGEENAEISRAVLTFLRVCVSVLSRETLMQILPRITSAFCSELRSLKTKFLKRSRGIMRKLLNRLGEDNLRPYVPVDTTPLLDYLLKQNRRHDRKEEAKALDRSNKNRSMEENLLDSDDDNGESDADADDGDTVANLMDVSTSAIQTAHAKLGTFGSGNQKGVRDDYRIVSRPKGIRPGERADSSMPATLTDLFEDQGRPQGSAAADADRPMVAKRRGQNNAKAKRKRSGSSDDEEEDEDGDERGPDNSRTRLTREAVSTPAPVDDPRSVDVYDPDEQYVVKVGRDGLIRIEENTPVEIQGRPSTSAGGGGGGVGSLGKAKKAEGADGGAVNGIEAQSQLQASTKSRKIIVPGAEYKSKKSGGDVWRKGMLEPHAYIPLDGRMLSKRSTREAVSKFDSVVRKNKGNEGMRVPSHVVQGNRKQRENRAKYKHGGGGGAGGK